MKPWIHEKLTEILGFEDDVVIDYAINQLEETNHPDPKAVQINLTGFLNAKVTKNFRISRKVFILLIYSHLRMFRRDLNHFSDF